MVFAEVIDYEHEVLRIGGPGPDVGGQIPCRSIYFRDESVWMATGFMTTLQGLLPTGGYAVRVGPEVEQHYRAFVEKLGVQPTTRELPNALVEWARAVHHAENPPAEIADLVVPPHMQPG